MRIRTPGFRAVGAMFASVLAACDTTPRASDAGDARVAVVVPDPSDDVDAGDTPSASIRRLSRPEYIQTARDLLGDYGVVADALPADQLSYLIANVSSAQTLQRLDLERYLDVAVAAIDRAWARRGEAVSHRVTLDPNRPVDRLIPSSDFSDGQAYRLQATGDEMTLGLDVAAPGQVRLHLRVRAEAAPTGPLTLRIVQETDTLASVDVSDTFPDGRDVSVLVQPAWRVTGTDQNHVRLTMTVDGASAGAPVLVGTGAYESDVATDEQRFATCVPAGETAVECARRLLVPFARRAWRRPVDTADIDRLVALTAARVVAGDAYDDAVKTALTAVLVSPRFLFRLESTDPAAGPTVDAHELAARLSYFLWGSMPDETLRAVAESGAILTDDELGRQVARMVTDPRFNGFVRNFAGQWLGFSAAGLPDIPPPVSQVPAAQLESQFFVANLFRANAPLTSLLSSTSAMVENSLARLYDYPGDVSYTHWTPVDLSALPRRGYLTQASFLMVTSPVTTITEPTVRGYFVLSRFLCSEPPPPPMTFDNFVSDNLSHGTLRASLEEHARRPECAGCHQSMDPIGFAFEGYDALGQHRTMLDGQPIDTTGTVPSLGSFANAVDLTALVEHDRRVGPCVVKQLMTYALGRGNLDATGDGLDAVRSRTGADLRLLDLLHSVVTSPQFRARAPREGY